jgi:hypothetical protein
MFVFRGAGFYMTEYCGLWIRRELFRFERQYNGSEILEHVFDSLEEKRFSIVIRGLVVSEIQGK